jgi:acyl-CoA thioesterase
MSESDGTVALPGFDADTAVEPLGEGRFAATISERWWVYDGPNGGYLAAVILRAILATVGDGQAARSLTVHFQQIPREGPVELSVGLERAGSRVTFLSARMEQEGRLHATAMAVLSEDWSEDGYSELRMPDAEPGELYALDPATAPANVPVVAQNYRLRPALGEAVFSGGTPYTGAWIRSREPRLLDAPLAAAFLDAWFPAPYVRLRRPLPAPTLDYTVHFRSPLPPPGAAPEDVHLVALRSRLARHGFFEEDGAGGVLLAQSRQLALLFEPAAAGGPEPYSLAVE